MKKHIAIILSLSAAFIFSSCEKNNVIRGEGPSSTENRTLLVQQGFSSIRISGSTDAEIVYGANYKLEVSGYSNLLNALSTDVSGGTLYVKFPDHHSVRNDNTRIILTIPHIPNLQLNGDIQASISGIFPAQPSLDFQINGSGEIDAEAANSNIDESEFTVNGSGDITAYNIISRKCEGNISGSGTIKTSVFNSLDVDISGSGDFFYKGNPTVTSQISGSGKVQRVN